MWLDCGSCLYKDLLKHVSSKSLTQNARVQLSSDLRLSRVVPNEQVFIVTSCSCYFRLNCVSRRRLMSGLLGRRAWVNSKVIDWMAAGFCQM